jgi:hypothetical protein
MWIIFEDSIADQHAYPIENLNAIFVTSTTNIIVYVRNPVHRDALVLHADDTIALTCTADKTDEVLDLLLDYITYPEQKILRISAALHTDITAVAYTAG